MKTVLSKENRTTLTLGAILIILGSCGFISGQMQHADARQHSDARWHDLAAHIDDLSRTCNLKEGP